MALDFASSLGCTALVRGMGRRFGRFGGLPSCIVDQIVETNLGELMNRKWWMILSVVLSLAAAGCSSGGGGSDEDVAVDQQVLDQVADVALDSVEVTPDGTPPEDLVELVDDTQVEVTPDTADAVEEVVEPTMRHFTFKGMTGISMGANGFMAHMRHPGHFDFVGAYGGYINYYYMAPFMRDRIFGGFCDMATLLANIEDLDNPEAEALQCGPVGPMYPWEFSWDFNHWHSDDSGGTWDRDFYWEAIEGMNTAFGNMLNYNPEHPYIPAGVPLEWLAPGSTTERCANAYHVGKPYNYSAEYNPEGEYDLITFCDGEEPISVSKDDPLYWELAGTYDPTYTHHRPVHLMLAVDYNGNGKRDFHEPVVLNTGERFQDLGADGCDDEFEDGNGGCTATGATGDPNGDNFDFLTFPQGTQNNNWYDEGEPYNDYGLDGVPDTEDFGEGDGVWSLNPNFKALLESSPAYWIDHAPIEDITSIDIFLDGGIRDALQASTSMWNLAQRLEARVPNTRFYHDFSLFDDSFYPAGERVMLTDVPVDWTAQGVGKNFIVVYGDPNASEKQIELGDGKHVGLGEDVFNRAATLFITPLHRWPNIDTSPVPVGHSGKLITSSFYSPGVQNRYRYAISLPPGYDMEENADQTYPVFLYLPGHGMTSEDTIAAGLVFNMYMELGLVGKFILAVPEGQCCYVQLETGKRYCACTRDDDHPGMRMCSDPECTGSDAECEMLAIPNDTLEQECNGGHFYANQKTNRWGDTSAAEYMKYEDVLFEFVEHLDATYRTRPAGDFEYSE